MSQLSERDTYVYLAKLAEQCERYDEMKENMKRVVTQNEELTIEERNLLSVAYKNVIGSRRASWRIISSQVPKDEKKDCMVQDAKEYKEVIEKELKEICNDILSLLSTNLIPTATTAESKVFYNKMKGDYYRYLAEFTSEAEKTQMAQESLQAYREAQTTAEVLPFTHPIRLGLALNFSVFFYEILVRREEACKLAKDSFEAAIKDLKDIDQDNYKDSTLILQLLRDNLTLWTSEVPDDVEQSQAQVEQIHVQDLEKED